MSKHVHAELMLQYAQDAMETDKPWERWQYRHVITNEWKSAGTHPYWDLRTEYRRKPKTIKLEVTREDLEHFAYQLYLEKSDSVTNNFITKFQVKE